MECRGLGEEMMVLDGIGELLIDRYRGYALRVSHNEGDVSLYEKGI